MVPSRTSRLLAFARDLQHAADFGELLDRACAEVREVIGYPHAWLAVADREDATEVRLINTSGDRSDLMWQHAATIPIAGDAMMEAVMRAEAPIVVEDALTDPRTNKAIVEQLRNRTIINIPLRFLDKPFGCLGVGTFGDEGVRVPTAEDLDYLVAMASQLSVAAARLRFQESERRAQREKAELERRLAQSQRLESVGLLAGGVAHDFNNLLTVILASASLAERPGQDPDVAAELATIREAADRGARLTRQLLAVSRTQPLQLQSVDVDARIDELLAMLKRIFPATIALSHLAHAANSRVEGDPVQIDQVLMNLCINARDAMPDGGQLTLETDQVQIDGALIARHPGARPGTYLLVTVTDTGTGIPAAILDRIFEPFFTTKGERAGTGLGLAVAYGIVRQHGGALQCYSEVGVGTTFKVYLPQFGRTAVVAAALPAVTPARGGHERLLVAEDDPAIRSALARVLDRAGYDAVIVATGDAACAAIDREAFDLVVLDVVMPGKSCRDTLAHLREVRPALRVLLSSGYSADTNVAELLRDGHCKFLRKPYDPEGLLRAVREALEG